MASPNHPIAAELVQRSAACGYNLTGFVGAAPFDACQSIGRRATDVFAGAGTIFLLGTGGGEFWGRLQHSGEEMREPAPDFHPINRYCERTVAEMVGWLGQLGIEARATFPDDAESLNFMHLAEMAGWGTVSPVLGFLLHPEFGPWVSMRAAILVAGSPFGHVIEEEHQPFQPCMGCHKPCVTSCPAGVFDGDGAVDLRACAEHRHAGHCASGCASRRACPVGEVARYSEAEESFRHAYSLFSMRSHFGLGAE